MTSHDLHNTAKRFDVFRCLLAKRVDVSPKATSTLIEPVASFEHRAYFDLRRVELFTKRTQDAPGCGRGDSLPNTLALAQTRALICCH
jgi:hypothetical protein